jgi:hypothetical protein
MVDYTWGRHKSILLCGLQEYVQGESVDPWHANAILKIEGIVKGSPAGTLKVAFDNLTSFVNCIKDIIIKTGTIPDLAGVGNLLMTPLGIVKLVDINNISKLSMDHHIPVDDKGYPVSDKSVQALFQIETRILGRSKDTVDTLYRFFLDPQRMKEVRELETAFHQITAHSGNYPSVN